MVQVDLSLVTVGREFYPDFELLLWHQPRECFKPTLGLGTRFRVILVEAGSGMLAYGDQRRIFSAPALFCLNETETPRLVEGQDLRAQALYFHPNVVNGSFDFDNLRAQTEKAEWFDQAFLRPFVLRDGRLTGLLALGPATAARFAHLFTVIGRELALQYDCKWPCRSRSYFLEVLFLLDRLYTTPDVAEQNLLSEAAVRAGVSPVLLYLHRNYGQKLSLDGLARTFNTNRTTLTQRFHAATGLPVMTYLQRLRLNLAALMLRDTELSIDEIAVRVGFPNLSHFGRAFRKANGQSPSKYRQQYCWMIQ